MRLATPFTTYPFNSLDHSLMFATKTGPQISGSSPSNPRSPRSGSHPSASTMDVPIPWIPTCFWCHYVPLPFFSSFFPFWLANIPSLVIDQHPHCIPTIPMVGSLFSAIWIPQVRRPHPDAQHAQPTGWFGPVAAREVRHSQLHLVVHKPCVQM